MEIKTLSSIVDEYIVLREERIAAAKLVTRLEEKEKALRDYIIETCRSGSSRVAGGTRGSVKVQGPNPKFIASDWEAVWRYIYENKASDLVHKRLTQEAVLLRKDDGVIIPGVESIPEYKLSVSGI